MKIIIIILIILILLFIYSLKFRNPYKLIMIFGKKGSGKNTLLTKLAIKYQRQHRPVYSDSAIFGTYKLKSDWLECYDFPPGSVIMIEEAGIIYDNRKFKNFSDKLRDFYKLQRHNKLTVYLASQSFDIDKKLRDLTDSMFLCVNYLGFLSVAKKINKKITISNKSGNDENSNNNNSDSFLTETYSFDFPFFWKFTFIPRYIPFFSSFASVPNGQLAPRISYEFIEDKYLKKLLDNRYFFIDFFKNIFVDISNLFKSDTFVVESWVRSRHYE